MDDAPGLPGDYDHDPQRFMTNQHANALFSRVGDVHPIVAERLAQHADVSLVADLGGGTGTLARLLARRGLRAVVVDRARHVARAPRPAVRADLRHLPPAGRSPTTSRAIRVGQRRVWKKARRSSTSRSGSSMAAK